VPEGQRYCIVITNRRLIETIRGRAAAAGNQHPLPSFAAHPRVLRALQRTIIGVGAAGFCAALLVGIGPDVMTLAARAAVSGGGASGSGSGTDGDATVTELAATDPVEATSAQLGAVVGDAAGAAVAVTDAAFPLNEASPEELVAAPVALVTPAPPAPAPPTPPTTVAPAPPPPEPSSVEAIIEEIFGAHGPAATRVARCESGLNPGAVSRGGGNWGLFQINKVHRGRVEAMGYRWEDILDARVNTMVAYSIFSEQGWGPWGCRHAAR
jgi:hypothetical protein